MPMCPNLFYYSKVGHVRLNFYFKIILTLNDSHERIPRQIFNQFLPHDTNTKGCYVLECRLLVRHGYLYHSS